MSRLADTNAAKPRAGPRPAQDGPYLSRTFRSLTVPEYRYLWLGMLALMGGTNMQMVARSQLAWDLTGSALAVGLVGAGFSPTILIFSLVGGAIADRVDKARVIQLGQLASAGISLFIGLSVLTGTITIYHLIASSMAQGMFWAFYMPARQAIIPQLVGSDLTSNGIALNASGMSLMTLAAPGLGGVIYWKFGPEATYFTITGLNLVACVLSSRLPRFAAGAQTQGRPILADMAEGLRYVRGNAPVLALLLMAAFTALLAMPFRSLLPVYVDELFARGPEAVGLLMSLMGAGALMGSLLLAGFGQGQGRGMILIGTTALSGIALLAASGATTYAVAAGVMILLGLGDAGRRALNNALVMEKTDAEHRGRVMGIYMMNFGLMPAGVIPLGAIAQMAGIRWAVLGAGGLLIVVSLGFLTLTSRIRRM